MVQFIRSSLSYFRPYWKSVSIVVAALLIQTAFKVGLPLGYSEIFDGAIAHTDLSYLKLLFCLLLVAWLLNLVAGLVQDRCTGRTGANVLTELRLRLFERLKGLPAANQSKRKSGDLLSLFSNDLAAIEVVYLKSAYTALYSSIVLVLSVGLLFVIEWRLALLTFISLPIALIGPRIIGAKAHRQNFDRKEYEALLTSELAENVGAVTEIRVFGLQANRLAHFRSHLSELKQRIQQAFVTAALVGRTSSQTVQVVQIVIMAVGGYLAIRGDLTVGSLVGFAALLMNVSNAANHLSAVIPEILPASAAFQRINVFLKANDCPNAPAGGQEFPKFSTIHFDDVSLSYDASETFSLREATFQVQSGQNVAIVGASGSGKSSILNLLLRLQSPTSG
ncbi:MAG: ABC transporter transmembrane domain-containing protein, partial [Coraliomargarita sp.]